MVLTSNLICAKGTRRFSRFYEISIITLHCADSISYWGKAFSKSTLNACQKDSFQWEADLGNTGKRTELEMIQQCSDNKDLCSFAWHNHLQCTNTVFDVMFILLVFLSLFIILIRWRWHWTVFWLIGCSPRWTGQTHQVLSKEELNVSSKDCSGLAE